MLLAKTKTEKTTFSASKQLQVDLRYLIHAKTSEKFTQENFRFWPQKTTACEEAVHKAALDFDEAYSPT